jgi:hypothetical protein
MTRFVEVVGLAMLIAAPFAEGIAGPGEEPFDDCNRNGLPDDRDLLSSPLRIHAPRSYNVRTAAQVGQSPRAIAMADLDADGIPDLVTANTSFGATGELSVFLGTGRGVFQPPRHVGAGDQPIDVVAADLDQDGVLDLAAASSAFIRGSSSISMVPGNGDGTFREAQRLDAGDRPAGIVAADLDADGFLDLAAANNASNDVTVLLGEGGGAFAAERRFAAGSLPSGIVALHAGDDGILDLITVNDNAVNVSILDGSGDGSFGAPRSFGAGGGPPASIYPGDPDIFAADLDSDGFTDLVLGKPGRPGSPESTNTTVVLGDGEGGFGDPQIFRAGENPYGVTAADLDGDGILDIATASLNDQAPSSPRLSWRRGIGDGTFHESELVPIVTSPNDLVSGDLDGDGTADLAVIVPDTILVFLGKGSGAFQTMQTVDAGGQIVSVATADLDNDGAVDLLATDESPTIFVGTIATLVGNGDTTFEPPRRFDVGQMPVSPLIVDLDGDGTLDYLSGGNSIRYMAGTGDGAFRSFRSLGPGTSSLTAGDLNGDGLIDLAGRNSSDSAPAILLLLGRGGGTFGPPTPLPVHSGTGMVLLADLDSNGRSDLLAAQPELGKVIVRLAGEDRLLGEEIPASIPEPDSILVLDADRDGNADLLAGSLPSRVLHRSLGNGDGSFEPPVSYDMQLGFSLSSADMNGDGVLDVVSGVGIGGAILPGNLDGTFQPQEGFSPGFFSAGDVNGDGMPDLVAPAGPQIATRIGLLLNETTRPASRDCNRNSMPDECDIEDGASNDGDRDGVPDECETNPVLPGDCNRDGAVDLSDIICVMNALFHGVEGKTGKTFPCETMDSNAVLLDWNGDAGIDLSDIVSAAVWLFAGGQEHAQGTYCIPVTGCLEACGQ